MHVDAQKEVQFVTIPQQPPEGEIPVPREPGSEMPPDGPTPDLPPPEAPPGHEPDWPPGTEDAPLRAPDENPDIETEL